MSGQIAPRVPMQAITDPDRAGAGRVTRGTDRRGRVARGPLRVHAGLMVGAAAAATAFTAFALRTPASWPFLPRAPMEWALKLLGAADQDSVADAELLGVWVPAFLLVWGLGYGVRALRREKRDR